MRRPFAAFAVLSAAAGVISLVGCGGSSSTSPKQTNFKSLSPAQQQDLENTAAQIVEGDIVSLTSLNAIGAFGFQRVATKRIAAGFALAGRAAPRSAQATDCGVESGNATDGDADGVPVADSITWGSDCTGISGYFAFGDPTPNTSDVDVNFAANLTASETSSGETINGTFGGTSSLSQGTGELDETGAWNYDFTISGASNADENGTIKLNTNESAKYVYGGAALAAFGSLPVPGTFSVNGNWNFIVQTTNVNVNLSFTVSTPTPLSINPNTCTGNPEGIDSGEVDIKFADGTLVKVLWSGCPAQPSFTIT